MALIDQIKEIASPVIEQLDCKLCDVTYAKEGKDYYLRLFVDRKEGKIDLDIIVKISEILSEVLDEANLIDNNYVLDISSLGAERPINVNELDKYLGYYIHVHLANPYQGENDMEGDVESVSDGILTLVYKEKTRTKKAMLKLDEIDRARLAIKF
ncbi:MAG: ribosome maturation factor RimP [Bacilli bacterium]|nr:ribosome maturation factor RimP [Bacilli bacterium]